MEPFSAQMSSWSFATGAIYACVALAVVMIYPAIDHLNFAQGEMAMCFDLHRLQLTTGASRTGPPSC